jgi:hypothetical protein
MDAWEEVLGECALGAPQMRRGYATTNIVEMRWVGVVAEDIDPNFRREVGAARFLYTCS